MASHDRNIPCLQTHTFLRGSVVVRHLDYRLAHRRLLTQIEAYRETGQPAATVSGFRAGRKTGAEGCDPWRGVVEEDEEVEYDGVYPGQRCT